MTRREPFLLLFHLSPLFFLPLLVQLVEVMSLSQQQVFSLSPQTNITSGR